MNIQLTNRWNVGQPKPKRRKIEIACDTCRLRKSRCDGERPKCGACMRRKNVGPICVYSEPLSERQIPLLDNENKFNDLTQPRTEKTPVQDLRESPSHTSAISEATRQSLSNEVDETAGNGPDWILKAGLLAASGSSNFFHTVFGTSEAAKVTENDPNESTKTLSNSLTHPSAQGRSMHSADYVLPSRKIADSLVNRFFDRAYIQWIDRLKFMTWYNSLWTGDGESEDLIDEQIHYANLNIMFALVYQSQPDEIVEDQVQLAQTYFLRAERLLQLNIMRLNRLDLLFAILLLTQWFQSVNNVRQCRSSAGLCIMIAHNLGLHVPGRIESLRTQKEREMARRAWHGCILIDRITAMISGQPPQISQDIAKQTPLFDEIDDEYLADNDTNGVQPPGMPAIPAFFRAFCQLHIILGDILMQFHDARNDSRFVIDVNHVIQIDDRLHDFAKALPVHLQLETDKQQKTYTGPIVHLHARYLYIRIMLYRVFFLRAAENLKKPMSTASSRFVDIIIHQGLLACVRSAQEILNLISSCLSLGDQGLQLIPQWWHTVTYVYSAATILIAAHIFPAIVEEITAGSLAASIQQSFQILDQPSRDKESARRCKRALLILCERHVNPANGPPKHTPNGTSIPADTWFQSPNPIDLAEVSANFGWDFTDPSDLFRGEGMETLLFNTNLFGQETNQWL